MKDQDGSVLDAGPPQSYVDKWYRLTGPQSNYSGQKQVQEKQAEGVASVTALANIDNAIKGWELDKQSCRETGNKQGLDEANRQLKNLYTTREHEVQRAKEAEKECAELQETQALHRMIYKQWDTLSFERQKRFVHLLIERVDLQEVSPHVVQLDITFKPPIAGTMQGFVWREDGGNKKWSDHENKVLAQLYPTADRAKIIQALPMRSWQAIRDQANVMGIARSTWYNASTVSKNQAWADQQIIPRIRGAYPEFGTFVTVAWEPFRTLNLYDLYNTPLIDIYEWRNVIGNGDKNFMDTSRRFHVPIRPLKIQY